MRRFLTKRTGAVALALTVGLVAGTAATGIAGQRGLPADKTAVAGSNLEDFAPNEEHPILSTRMAVSSPADLILGVTLECSIVNRLVTNTNKETATSHGQVDIRVTVDGKDVPVQSAGEPGPGPNGRVTFCNRTYNRTMKDQDGNGLDEEDDYLATKTANAFNWVALNVGVDDTQGGYDSLLNGNNVIDVKVYAKYSDASLPGTCATAPAADCTEAYVGQRTLVIEPVHAARGEQSSPIDPAATL